MIPPLPFGRRLAAPFLFLLVVAGAMAAAEVWLSRQLPRPSAKRANRTRAASVRRAPLGRRILSAILVTAVTGSLCHGADATPADETLKEQARGLLKKLDALGEPLALQFQAVDGQSVDLARMKGKVVLIDFWATWCGPCVAELPRVKAASDRLHPQGFEIIGISFDQKTSALEDFVKEQAMPWPQFFDGEGWKNKFGREFGIQSIPTMWLVDRQGVLRDMNAREDLPGKVERLLAQ